MEAGHSDICFCRADETRTEEELEISNKKQAGMKYFAAYKLASSHLTLSYTDAHIQISHSHILLRTTLEYKLLHANWEHGSSAPHILQHPTISISQPICVTLTERISLSALAKTSRMSQRPHYSRQDGCRGSSIGHGLQLNDSANLLHHTGPAASQHSSYLCRRH